MLLKNLIKNSPQNLKKLKIRGLALNSKDVKKGFIFFAVKGNQSNGENYINEAIKNGAIIIICSKSCKFQSTKANIIKTRKVRNYLSEIIRSYQEISQKNFLLDTEKDKNSVSFRRSVEINYGLRNFIGNANKFSKQKIEVKLLSDGKNTEIQISDDGPGFPKDIIDKLGEPYIKSSLREVKPKIGLGLGTFIGKTLLEKNYGKINFKNSLETKGALVNISWLNSDLNRI